MAPVVTPASRAISATVDPSYPLRSKVRAAASTSRPRVSSAVTPAMRATRTSLSGGDASGLDVNNERLLL